MTFLGMPAGRGNVGVGEPAFPAAAERALLDGKQDDVIHYSHTVHAAERLVQLGADLTADVVPFTGHGISEELQDLLVERLRGHIPKHVWEEAMRNAPG